MQPAEQSNIILEVRQETLANKVSIYASAVFFPLSLAVGILTDSMTLLLDAGAWLVGVVTGIFYHYSIKNSTREPDTQYPFGYSKYEPFTVLVEGILITVSCIFSSVFAVQDIIHPDDLADYAPALLLTSLTGLAALGVGFYLSKAGKNLKSDILAANSIAWYVDAAFAFGMFAGFGTGKYFQSIGWHTAAMYVDPVMCIALACFLLPGPALLIRRSALELLDASPGGEVAGELIPLANAVSRDYELAGEPGLRFRKSGRKLFLDVRYMASGKRTLAELKQAEVAFQDQVLQKFPQADIHISFAAKDT